MRPLPPSRSFAFLGLELEEPPAARRASVFVSGLPGEGTPSSESTGPKLGVLGWVGLAALVGLVGYGGWYLVTSAPPAPGVPRVGRPEGVNVQPAVDDLRRGYTLDDVAVGLASSPRRRALDEALAAEGLHLEPSEASAWGWVAREG